MSADSIRVLLVDDHAMVRGGLTRLNTSYEDMELLGAAVQVIGARATLAS